MQATPSGGSPQNPPNPGQGDGNGKKKQAWIIPCIVGCAIIFGLSSCAGIGIFAAIAVPNFRKARNRANQRACFANQKTLAGALEMYNLDNNVDDSELNEEMLKKLQNGGYLQRIPNDPGQGENTSHHYLKINYTGADGRPTWRIFCTHHGFVRPPNGTTSKDSPRRQLEALGVTDSEVLSQARNEIARSRSKR